MTFAECQYAGRQLPCFKFVITPALLALRNEGRNEGSLPVAGGRSEGPVFLFTRVTRRRNHGHQNRPRLLKTTNAR